MNTLQRYASTLRSCSDQQRILIILIVVVYNAEYALPAFAIHSSEQQSWSVLYQIGTAPNAAKQRID